jgi:PHD/YefM family antitoxin component YafN of YafNO toxin-antitoxin module
MSKKMNITEARDALMKLPEMFDGNDSLEAIEVTKWGKRVLAIMPWEEYESIAETKEILKDRATLRGIARGLEDVKEGRMHAAEDVRKKLGI